MLPRFQIPDVEIVVWSISVLPVQGPCSSFSASKEQALPNLFGDYKFVQKNQGPQKRTFIKAEVPISGFLRSVRVNVSTP